MDGNTVKLGFDNSRDKGIICPLQGPERSWGLHSFLSEPSDLKLITHIKRVVEVYLHFRMRLKSKML